MEHATALFELKAESSNSDIPVFAKEILNEFAQKTREDAEQREEFGTLAFCDYYQLVSAASSVGGWLWLVGGRSVVLWWRMSDETASYRLTLPASGLKYHANLVAVQPCSDSGVSASVLAVSPEGVIRYWPSAATSDVYLEVTIDCEGQVVDQLVCLQQKGGYLIGTTTFNFYQIQVVTSAGGRKSEIFVTPWGSAAGTSLKGIGRRVSSLIFASSPLSEHRLVRLLSIPRSGSRQSTALRCLCVAQRTVQCWSLSDDAYTQSNSAKLDWEVALGAIVKEIFVDEIWSLHGEVKALAERNTSVYLLDAIPFSEQDGSNENGVLFLIAVARQTHSLQRTTTSSGATGNVTFALAFVDSLEGCIADFAWLLPIDLGDLPRTCADLEECLYALRLHSAERARPSGGRGFTDSLVFVVGHSTAHCVRVPHNCASYAPSTRLDTKSVALDDVCVGSGFCYDSLTVFLASGEMKILRLLPKHFDAPDSLSESRLISQYEEESVKTTTLAASKVDQATLFRMAFVSFTRKHISDASEVLDGLLSGEYPLESSDLAVLAVQLGAQILDDVPAKDPRWSNVDGGLTAPGDCTFEEQSSKLLSSDSLLLAYQLEDKRKLYSLFVNFLKSMALWHKLAVPCDFKGRRAVDARYFLAEFAEQLECAISLYNATQNDLPPLLEEAMRNALLQNGRNIPSNLSVRDVFFTCVSTIPSLFALLLSVETGRTRNLPPSATDGHKTVIEMCEYFLVMLEAVRRERSAGGRRQLDSERGEHSSAFTSWTMVDGVREALCNQYELGIRCLSAVTDTNLAQLLGDQLCRLCDLILEDASACCSASDRTAFNRQRTQMIGRLIDVDETAAAAEMAERRRDFASLVRIADATVDTRRKEALLADWKEKFEDDGFREFLYDWYLTSGKPGDLFRESDEPETPETAVADRMDNFLSTHRPELSWIMDVKRGRFDKASTTLKDLAQKENELVSRQKTLFSLSKLCALASDTTDEFTSTTVECDKALDFITQQQQIPLETLNAAGYSEQKVPPLSLERSVELLIDSSSDPECCWARALRLCCTFIPIETRITVESEATLLFNRLKKAVWLRALNDSDWSTVFEQGGDQYSGEDYLKRCKTTPFFKTVSLLCDDPLLNGEMLLRVIPSADEMLAWSEVDRQWKDDVRFQHLMRAGQEWLQRFVQSRQQTTSVGDDMTEEIQTEELMVQ